VKYEVEMLVGDSTKCSEVAGLVVVAAAHGKAQSIDGGAGRRGGLRPADLTDFAAGAEAVPVFASWLKSVDLDVDAVTKLGSRDLDSFLLDHPERLIARDLPTDFQFRGRHAAAIERIGSEPRPQHDAGRPRIT